MLWLTFLSGCLTLDPLLPFHDNVPCSEVGDSTCSDVEDDWDKLCTPCEEEYDWDRVAPWREQTFEEGESIPTIDPTIVQSVKIDVDDEIVVLDAYFIPSNNEVSALSNTTIVYNHGRYAGIDHYLPRVQLLHKLGFNVFVWDYRGYGKSLPDTAPSSPDWMSDALAAFDAALTVAPDANKMIVYSMSVGGFPGGEMMAKRNLCAQIFEAAVISVTKKIEENLSVSLPGSFLTSGALEGDLKLKDTTHPTLIMHGTKDETISINSSRQLFEDLPEDLPKEMIEVQGAGHGVGGLAGVPDVSFANHRDHLLDFLESKAPDCLEN
jgi:pimeloyl-ACP methyl ester carboxylesterase